MFALLRQRDFGLLWTAGLISLAGSLAMMIALPIHIYQQTDSTLATAAIFAATHVPGILFGSFAGVFVDRWDRKRTMVLCNIIKSALLLPIVLLSDQLLLLYVIAAAQGMAGLFFSPAERAFLPTLVGKEKLVAANALNSLNDNLAILTGPAIGAVLYSQVGLEGAALFNAVAFAASAALIRLIRADGRAERAPDDAASSTAITRVMAEWRDGLRIVRHDRTLGVLFASWSFVGIADGVFGVLGLAPLVLDVLGGTSAQVGWLMTAQAIGGIVAGLLVVRFSHRLSLRWMFAGGIIALGFTDMGAFNAFRIAPLGTAAVLVAMGWMILGGFPAVAGSAAYQSIIQGQTVDAYRGRVFGALRSAVGLMLLVGIGLGGYLGDAIGLVPVLTASALVRMIGGGIALAYLPHEPEPVPDIATTHSPPVGDG